MSEHITTAAGIEAQTSTAALAQEVHEHAERSQKAAKEAATTAQSVPSFPAAEPAATTTTAANAEVHAPSRITAKQVHESAEQTQDVAQEAAAAAHRRGPGVTGESGDAVTQLGAQTKATTDAAVAEGKHDIAVATATGHGYLDQAEDLASSALATAQSYLPTSITGVNPSPAATTQTGSMTGSLHSTASSAAETAKSYLVSAQSAAQPHIGTARSTLASGLESAKGYLHSEQKSSESTGIPSTSAPLESGPHIVGTPYPSTTTDALKIGENEKKSA